MQPKELRQLWKLGANVAIIGEGEKKPTHVWEEWQSERQPKEAADSLIWQREATYRNGKRFAPSETLAIFNGIGWWRTLDVDARKGENGAKIVVPETILFAILDALGLPHTYPWAGHSRSGAGWHILFRCEEPLPDTLDAAREKRGSGVITGTPHTEHTNSFDHLELRWERCLTALPHITGYGEVLPAEPPALVSAEAVAAAFDAIATPKTRGAKPAPAPVRNGQRVDVERTKDAIASSFDLVAWFCRDLNAEVQAEGREVRILGEGGLLVRPDEGCWYNHSEEHGGGWAEAIAYTRYGGVVPKGAEFIALLGIAADFAGVPITYEAHSPNGRGAQPAAQPAQASPNGRTVAPAQGATPQVAQQDQGKPVIDITDENLGRVTDAIWAAMASSPYGENLYRYGTEVAYLDGKLTTVDDTLWRGMVNRAASFVTTRESKGGAINVTEVIPPLAMIRDSLVPVFVPPSLPTIDRLSPIPIFDERGQLLTNGYHADSRTLVVSDITPEKITPAEALSLILDDLLIDFPFASAADRANAVAYILLPFIREMCGATPVFLLDAAQRGTGKTLLNDLVHTIWTGQAAPLSDLPLNAEEQRKAITTHLMGAPVSVVFDDISTLQGHALQRAVTGQTWTDRLLGANKEVSVPIRTIWAATGNNVTLGGDMVRRTVLIRLESAEEHPSQRVGFKRSEGEIRAWARENRPRLVSACLSLIAQGLATGQAGGIALGGFGQFATVVTRILNGIGISGFCENLTAVLSREDGRQSGWKRVISAWWDAYNTRRVKAGDVAKLIEDDADSEIIIDGDTPRARAITAGKLLRAKLGAVFAFDDVRLRVSTSKNLKGDTLYALEEVRVDSDGPNSALGSLSGSSGSSGYSSSPYSSGAHACASKKSEASISATSATSATALGSQKTLVIPEPRHRLITLPKGGTLKELVLTPDWQVVPDGWAIPSGADIHMDMETGRNMARMPNATANGISPPPPFDCWYEDDEWIVHIPTLRQRGRFASQAEAEAWAEDQLRNAGERHQAHVCRPLTRAGRRP